MSPIGPRARVAWNAFVLGACLVCVSCSRDAPAAPHHATAPAETDHDGGTTDAHAHESPAPATREIELLPALAQGSIDAHGVVVDFGEPQSNHYIVPPMPISVETLNGDSWASVGPRVRMRVPIDTTQPPTFLRMRVRHPHARAVLAIVDGLPVRQARLPTGPSAQVVTIPLLPDRFRRDVTDLELRFLGISRTLGAPQPAQRTAPPPPPSPPRQRNRTARSRHVVRPPVVASHGPPVAVVDLDWIHLARDDTPVVRVSDLTADVHSDGPPRRAITLYSPAALGTVTVIPHEAVLRGALSAEGIHGAAAGPGTVHALVRVEADGVEPIEYGADITAGAPWQEFSLDLRSVVGKAARIVVSASDGHDTRLALADPRIESRPDVPPTPPPIVRHVVMLVVRGARYDRFAPALSSRFRNEGFARVARDALIARAVAASPRSLSAFASVVTGLPADVHEITDLTDTLDENAPTLATVLHEAGIATAGFSDDRWWEGSGLDRGFNERGGCTGEQALCRAESALGRAAEWIVREREQRAFVLVTTRAGLPPFDPPPDLLATIDPSAPDNAITSERSGALSQRAHGGALALDQSQLDRLAALYDSSLAGVDRGLAALLDRLRDAGMLSDTAIVIVGDRGVTLGESGVVGDGPGSNPMGLVVVSHTILIVRTPGITATHLNETVSTLDAAATVLERFGLAPDALEPAQRAGAVSVFSPGAGGMHPRGAVFASDYRGDLGVRFGELLALGHGGGVVSLYQPDDDPLGANDLASQRPTALAFAESVLSGYRTRNADDPSARTFVPSTRTLSPAVETALRGLGWLRR